jgi:hypothetical protein
MPRGGLAEEGRHDASLANPVPGLPMVLSGCVAVRQVPLPESASSRFAGQTLQRSVYPKPDFAAYTAGKAGFGLIGVALIISAGNDIIREHAVEDPAIRISQEAAQTLVERYGLQLSTSEPKASQSDDIGALVQTYGEADLILDIKTINWMFIYFPTDWSHYRILYSARLRVIDRQQKTVIGEGFCAYKPEYEDTKKAPTRDELLNNDAEGLKRELAKAGAWCITFFRSGTFRILITTPAPPAPAGLAAVASRAGPRPSLELMSLLPE